LLIRLVVVALVQRCTPPNALAKVNHLESNPQIKMLGRTESTLGPKIETNRRFVVPAREVRRSYVIAIE
jgi:hypothetical protein